MAELCAAVEAKGGAKLTRERKDVLETLWCSAVQAAPEWLPLPLPLEAPPPSSLAAKLQLHWSEEPSAARLFKARIVEKIDWANFAQWVNGGRKQP